MLQYKEGQRFIKLEKKINNNDGELEIYGLYEIINGIETPIVMQ